MAEPTYRLEKLNFDGPLDLLLKLIEKNKVDIYDIPIVEITEQYFEYIKMLDHEDLEIISDFLVMAATLLDIKARMLLPGDDSEPDEEGDPREELVARLLEYKRCKYIAHELRIYEEHADRYLYSDAVLPDELKSYVPPVDLDSLLKGVTPELLRSVYERVLKRMAAADNTPNQQFFGVIKKERISLVSCIENMVSFAKNHRRFSFRQILKAGAGRTEVVASFLAVLELMRMGVVNAEQKSMGGDIDVEVTGDADLEAMDLSGIEDR